MRVALLLMGGKQACEQRLRTNRRADDLAGVGVVTVVHIGFGVLGPILDLRHSVDVEQAHERSLAVVAHRRRIGTREGIVAEELAFACLAERLSRSVEALDYEAYLPTGISPQTGVRADFGESAVKLHDACVSSPSGTTVNR